MPIVRYICTCLIISSSPYNKIAYNYIMWKWIIFIYISVEKHFYIITDSNEEIEIEELKLSAYNLQ